MHMGVIKWHPRVNMHMKKITSCNLCCTFAVYSTYSRVHSNTYTVEVDTLICTLILHFLSKINDSISTPSHSHMNSQTDGTANSSNLGFNILTKVWVKAAILYIYFHLYCFYDSFDCLNCFYWIINLKLVELKQLPSASESFNFNSRFYTTIFWPCRSVL